MIKPNQLSKCHNAPVVVCEGDAWDVKTVRRGSTYYYGCTECKEACDVAPSSDKGYISVNLAPNKKVKAMLKSLGHPSSDTPEREKLCDCGTMKSSHKKMYHEKQQTFGEPSSDTNELKAFTDNFIVFIVLRPLLTGVVGAKNELEIYNAAKKIIELIATKEQQARIDENKNNLNYTESYWTRNAHKHFNKRIKELKGDI